MSTADKPGSRVAQLEALAAIRTTCLGAVPSHVYHMWLDTTSPPAPGDGRVTSGQFVTQALAAGAELQSTRKTMVSYDSSDDPGDFCT
ncbi:hypothetical protein E4U30_003958 [Claviceps sp. LM220 group G6]|nr:hypothetical protein E4U15_002445 [Claviceps sp. LM218 group G6]KAG6093864.1 hypothetical protein E4U30_003958 [Claviceps sp. LM220 group G6]KAG6104373.1 hypothetical protein E4U31_002042 [Claviceps sp. LM219 group G6]